MSFLVNVFLCFCFVGFPICFGLPGPYKHIKHQQRHPRNKNAETVPQKTTPGIQNCSVNFFTQTIDHFNFGATPDGTTTFQQRYFVYNQTWQNNSNGVIFFYLGNEADVSLYVDHTGLMWENAEAFNAMLIFAEHRYYGL